MIRTYHYRCLPNRKQARFLDRFLEMAQELYNAALQERRDACKRCRRSIRYFGQHKQLTRIRQRRRSSALVRFGHAVADLALVKNVGGFGRIVAQLAPELLDDAA